MKLRLQVFACVLLPWIFWQCATPAPVVPPPAPRPAAVSDDQRAVSATEFFSSPWRPSGPAVRWAALPHGATFSLADGRELTLNFVTPTLVRWWVPAGPSEQPRSPAGRYQPALAPAVEATEAGGVVTLTGPELTAKVTLADLSWTVLRGTTVVLHSAGGPRWAGRRVMASVVAGDAALWTGPGLSGGPKAVRHWVEAGHEFAFPALFGAGGALPFALALDTGYQSYTAVGTEASLGALNGGLDLVVSVAPQVSTVVSDLTGVFGRPEVPPTWALGTALVLPDTETGAFVRKAKLSVETAVGTPMKDRLRFQVIVPGGQGLLPDLSLASVRTTWATQAGWANLAGGAALGPMAGRSDWQTVFDDQGRASPLARMEPRLPVLEAEALADGLRVRAPFQRPLVLAASGAPGLVRHALGEYRPGQDDAVGLSDVLALGLAGSGPLAVRLDLSGLAAPETQPTALAKLAYWLWAPVLTLDWGPSPAAAWASLSDAEKQTLKTLLARRSQLKPYLAQAVREAAATGRPTWAPLWFRNPGDTKALQAQDEFWLGSSLVAAPATGATRSVYLPGPGVWFDFWTGEEFGGGRSYDVEVKADRPLLFVPGGAMVPVREAEVFDEKDIYNPLTVHVFPGGNGTGTYWADDGATLGYKTGAYLETRLTYGASQKSMVLEHDAVNATARVQADPYLLYRLHNVYKPRQVRIAGKAIPLFGDSWGITDTDRSAAWYESDHTLLVKTFHPERDQTIEMDF